MSDDELKEVDLIVDSKEIRILSQINTFKSLFQIFLEYFGIIVAILICIKFWSIPIYLLCSLYITSRKHGLGIIMHDGIHYKISKNKTINDLITDFFICFPLFASLYNGRNIHFQHHKNTNTDDDPDWIVKKGNEWIFPQKKLTFFKNIFKNAFGIHVFLVFISNRTIKQKLIYAYRSVTLYLVNSNIKKLKLSTYRYSTAIKITYYFTLCMLLIYFNLIHYFILFWLLPSFLWMPFISRIRTISEHFGMKEHENKDFSLTRTTYPSFIDRYFLSANWNSTYHLDHHLYPSVPSYNLNKLHKLLVSSSSYNKYAHITPNGFWGVYLECTKKI